MKSILGITLAVWLAAAVPGLAHDTGTPEDAITHLMMTTFDKPDLRLQVSPIAVEGTDAIAGWTQGW